MKAIVEVLTANQKTAKCLLCLCRGHGGGGESFMPDALPSLGR